MALVARRKQLASNGVSFSLAPDSSEAGKFIDEAREILAGGNEVS